MKDTASFHFLGFVHGSCPILDAAQRRARRSMSLAPYEVGAWSIWNATAACWSPHRSNTPTKTESLTENGLGSGGLRIGPYCI